MGGTRVKSGKCQRMSQQQQNKLVFSLFLKTGSDEADVTSAGRLFHTLAPATGKARYLTVD